ncbi:DUF2357 domain-containing protein [Polaribacter haliotis]|uniref:DUF2357 domain-containing protein n=1 Tax=Polaribacter haliotis TaxID=1888915 RepID=A0A7L8AJM5_9FLAO|nr:DUF2357 domain-containing protein [Polaribacter haliotis]QOD62173.1 DUF2357 domain-containing protein [Polaribacter haliotis]
MKDSLPFKRIEFKQGLFLTITPIGDHAKIYEIDASEAEEFGEAAVQILESKRYDFEFSDKGFEIICRGDIVKSLKHKNPSRGIIAPGNYVGTLELIIKSEEENIKCYLEILATKFDADDDFDISYRKNYRSMIEDITEKCTELLMQSNSPVNQYFEPDFTKDNKTIYQKFSFVKSVIDSNEFEESLLRIFSAPKTNWVSKEEKVDIRSLKRVTNSNLKEILRGTNRIPLPKSHRLSIHTKLESLPAKINSYKQESSLDNPENRFIKHALQEYLQFCKNCSSVFENDSKDEKEANFLANKIEGYLNHSFFKEISRPTTLKLNSPTLQRKSGYRQILKSWLMFDLASKLTWTGGQEDVYEAGKRDIATLYEYWLFFVLYDLFRKQFNLTELSHKGEPYTDLFEKTKNGLNLIIKSGRHTALKGDTVIKNRGLSFKFSFNRTFSGYKDSFPKAGSWTTSMRPDYTLSIWPKELKEAKAEVEEQIVHIHFDAKYKVNHFKVKTNSKKKKLAEEEEFEELNKIKKQERAGVFKNADLLKMHAYKDAIRRTGGAYILYPGNTNKKFKGFHELIPGLGAFSVNPKNVKEDKANLLVFIEKVIDNLVNRASQRENIASKTYEITKGGKTESLNETMPEYINEKKLIPDETYVLVGYYNPPKNGFSQIEWIEKEKLYNFRIENKQSGIKLGFKESSAKYLLLHTKGENSSNNLWEIVSDGPQIHSRKTMIKNGYKNPSQDYYLVLKIKKVDITLFGNKKWKFKSLENFRDNRQSPYPFTTTLTELMQPKISKE